MLRRLSNLTVYLGFIALLCLPLALFSSASWTDPVERRSSAPWPGLPHSLAGITSFAPEFEAYFNDHFGLRRVLIDLRNRLDLDLFGQSPTPKVLLAPDNWLFYTEDHSIDDFRGRAALGAAALADWYQAIEARRSRLAEQGILYRFVVVPNKESIYPERMPRSVIHGSPSRLDQLADYLTTKGEAAWLGDLRPVLLARKPALPLYNALDLHWTEYGAYLAYQRIAAQIDQAEPDAADPIDLPEAMFARSETAYGDLADQMGLHPFPVPVETARYAGPALPCQASEVPLEPSVLLTNGARKAPDMAADCPQAGGARRALIFHDSMIQAMRGYLANSFTHVRFAWLTPSLDDIERYVAVEHPDVVIEERIERTLVDPPQQTTLPQIVTGAPPAADRIGWVDVVGTETGVVTVEGWGQWQPQDNSRRIGIDTNLPVIGSELAIFERPDVVVATKDPNLARSGFRLRLTLDPAKPRPEKIRLCLWTEDPALGQHRLNSRGSKGWDACAAG